MESVIKKGRVYECPECERYLQFPVEIYEENFPLEISCTTAKCGYKEVWDDHKSMPPLPKGFTASSRGGPYWNVRNAIVENQDVSSDDKNWKIDQAIKGMSLREQTNLLAENIISGMSIASIIKGKINDLAEAMSNDLEQNWSSMRAITEFRRGEVAKFIMEPIGSIKIAHYDKAIEALSCVAISPSFYPAKLGIPLSKNRAYNVWLINPYSRISYPVSEWLRESLDIERTLDLTVIGNKIVGDSLREVWLDIPYFVKNDDHTEHDPSISIGNLETRLWLAKHGVCPWTEDRIAYRKDAAAIQDLESSSKYHEAWNALITYRRIGICWPINEARQFCMLACNALRGTKLFVVRDSGGISNWWSGASTNSERSLNWVSLNEMQVNKMNVTDTLVVDAELQISSEFAEELFNFKGNLIYLRKHAIVDHAQENAEDSMFYSSVARVFFSDFKAGKRAAISYAGLQMADILDLLIKSEDSD